MNYNKFIYFALKYEEFPKQTKLPVIPHYKNCLFYSLLADIPEIKKCFYIMFNQQLTYNFRDFFYGLISSHPEIWRETFCDFFWVETKNFKSLFPKVKQNFCLENCKSFLILWLESSIPLN